MKNTISYSPFEKLAAHLHRDGLKESSDKLLYLMNDVAWTTGSELIGELGQEIKRIKNEHNNSLSSETKREMKISMEMVKRIWPDFPE